MAELLPPVVISAYDPSLAWRLISNPIGTQLGIILRCGDIAGCWPLVPDGVYSRGDRKPLFKTPRLGT